MENVTQLRRLNFGCGYDQRDGYLNVDSDPACQPDVLLVDNDLSVLPKHSFDEVLALDVLEHIPRVQTLGVLLEWADLLVDRGSLVIKTSSIQGVATQLAADPSFREQYGWVHCLFGTQAHPGDFHFTGFTDTTLTVHLLAAGFEVERVWLTDRWLLNAEATKASSWSQIATDLADAPVGEYVEAIYRSALGRDADPAGVDYLTDELASGRLDRRGALRHLMSSPERLFFTAERHGFGGTETDVVPRPIAHRMAQHVPPVLKPTLRSIDATVRSTAGRVRRATGALAGR